MAEEGGQPIIIKRVKKGAHAAHGGAWKVAYADFVTAMMAFFLLLWLLNSVTEEQLSGISDYFAPTTVSSSSSGAGGVLGGQTIGEGAQTSNTASPGVNTPLPPPTIGQGGEDYTDPTEGGAPKEPVDPEAAAQAAQAQAEQQQFQDAMDQLEQAINNLPEAQALAKSLKVDNTLEGLRIQVVDQEGLAMFPSGQSVMYEHTKQILETVTKVIGTLPQKLSIYGHTDATQFADPSGYTNWELSADRALATRRVLLAAGIPETRIDRVVGKAATEPYVSDDPKAPSNRRIAIILLREFKPGEDPNAQGDAVPAFQLDQPDAAPPPQP